MQARDKTEKEREEGWCQMGLNKCWLPADTQDCTRETKTSDTGDPSTDHCREAVFVRFNKKVCK